MQIIYELLGSLLYGVYGLVQNYGLAIIIFTIIIKLILYPLTLKQTNSMKKMNEIQPKIKELQEKYKNNKEKLNEKTMELYRDNKVNPAGGCFPLLLQFPVLIGLFRILQDPQRYVFPAEVYDSVVQNFLWLPDLGSPDPYFILPVLAAVFTYLSTKMMSANNPGAGGTAGQTQKTMNTIMPLMIGFISLQFPSGLALYWVISNLFQIGQQAFALRKVPSNEEVSK